MKLSVFLLLFLTAITRGNAQDLIPAVDDQTPDAQYHLPLPEGWGTERIPFPINFAPEIPYKGLEDIRFAPGWAKVKSEEYWTYAFLWYLDAKPKTSAKIIAENLKLYYTGLIKGNTPSPNDVQSGGDSTIPIAIGTANDKPQASGVTVTTSFKKVKAEKTDLETYRGSIQMMDYMQKKPITLNCIVHLKVCAEENKTILFYELSPKPFTHSNWVSLDKLWTDFKCRKD